MPFAPLDAARLYFERAGSGPRVLAISGTGSDLRTWANPLRWPIADGFDLLAYDHRGLGRSEPAEPAHQPTMADFAADAIGLLDAVGWDRCSIVGVSFGGMVAQEVAIALGDRVERLVLACTSPGGEGGSSYPLHELSDLPGEERIDATIAAMDRRMAEDPVRAGRVRPLLKGLAEPPTPGQRRQLAARRTHDTWDRLARITAPTLVAAGRHDGIAPLPNSEALASRIPNAVLQVFDGGHAFFAEDRSAFPAMAAFLRGEAPVRPADAPATP